MRLDLLRPSAPADREALVTLSSAALAQQRIYLHYRAPDGRDSEREFDPYGLVLWDRHWYALGMCQLRQEMRSFRLDRIVRTALARPPVCAPARL
ncbi:WYL domain-containing protein [Massilia sp. H-1]|nr:WYL domain-containing protein [Massilia sp. H-1]